MQSMNRYVTDVGWRMPEDSTDNLFEVTMGVPNGEEPYFHETQLDLVKAAKNGTPLPVIDTIPLKKHDGRTIVDLIRRIRREDERYIIEAKIGKGAEGIVFEVDDKVTGEHIAVKTSNEEGNASLKSEFDTLKEIEELDIAPKAHALIKENNKHYLFMELFDKNINPNLRDVIKSDFKGMDQREKNDLCLILFEKYKRLETTNRRHGDIKPENIVITRNPINVKFMDWGSSYKGTLQGAGYDGFTMRYASPERIGDQSIRGVDGVADNRDDLFALTIIAFEIQVGVHPLVLMENLGKEIKSLNIKQFWKEFSILTSDENFWMQHDQISSQWKNFFKRGFSENISARFQSADDALECIKQ